MFDAIERVFLRSNPEDADAFVEGEYLHKRRGHVAMPVRIWWGPPRDPEHGGEMDRSPRWNVEIAGDSLIPDERDPGYVPIARLEDVWPRALGARVDRPETAYRDARVDYARRHDPEDPFGHPQGRLDLLTATIPN